MAENSFRDSENSSFLNSVSTKLYCIASITWIWDAISIWFSIPYYPDEIGDENRSGTRRNNVNLWKVIRELGRREEQRLKQNNLSDSKAMAAAAVYVNWLYTHLIIHWVLYGLGIVMTGFLIRGAQKASPCLLKTWMLFTLFWAPCIVALATESFYEGYYRETMLVIHSCWAAVSLLFLILVWALHTKLPPSTKTKNQDKDGEVIQVFSVASGGSSSSNGSDVSLVRSKHRANVDDSSGHKIPPMFPQSSSLSVSFPDNNNQVGRVFSVLTPSKPH